MNSFKIGLVQMRMGEDANKNLSHAMEMIEKAAKQGAQVICLPELFRTPYFCQTEEAAKFDLAEELNGETSKKLSALAKELDVVVIASLFEKRALGLYHNTTITLDADGEQAGVYRKMHIPDDPQFYEKYYFTQGDLGFSACDTKFGKIGTLICWDQWYPEAARLTAMQGASVLFYPTAIGWQTHEKAGLGAAQADAWETIQRSHAIANGVFVASCNRIGKEGDENGLEFWGNSFVADPFGRIIAKASSDKEEIITAICDPALIEETRRDWPFFRDRRIDAYGDIVNRFGK